MKTVVVDSDGLVALLYQNDAHAQTAERILQSLIKQEARLLYPATVIVETATLFQLRLKQPAIAEQLAGMLREAEMEIVPVDGTSLGAALTLFRPREGSAHNTLFDAVVAATAKAYKADAIFSFDGWYKSLGFTLADAPMEQVG